MKALIRFLVLASAILPFGCLGTETGNPPASDETATSIDVVPPTAGFQGPDGVDPTILSRADELTQAFLSLARAELLPAGSCDDLPADDAEVAEAIPLDLPHGGALSLPEGSYCALRLWPARTEDDPSVPELLRGFSFAVRIDDQEGAPYVIVQSAREAPILLRPDEASFEVASGDSDHRLATDVASALIDREFWTHPAEADGSWRFFDPRDAAFLRELEVAEGLFLLFVGTPLLAEDGGTGGGTESELAVARSGP